MNSTTSTVVHVLVGAMAAAVAFWKLKPLDQASVDAPATPFGSAPQVEEDQVRKLLRKAGKADSPTAVQAKFFALVIASPAEVRKRIVERYRLDERTVRQTVTIEVQVPSQFRASEKDAGEDFFYFPLFAPQKGKLLDNWQIYDGAGEELPSLNYREYLLIAVRVLRLLLVSACGGAQNTPSGLTPEAERVEHEVVRTLLRRHTKNEPLDPSSVLTAANSIRRLTAPRNGNAEKAGQARELAAKLVEKIGGRYLVVAVLSPDRDGRFIAKYEQTLIPDLELAHERKWISSLVGSKSVALGARPMNLTVGIENASTCDTYHLIVEGSEGSYLGRQEVVEIEETLKTTARDAPGRPHARFRQRLGQPYGHFYVRYFPEPAGTERPQVRFQYFEVPPGSLLRAAVTAVASFFLVWVIGVATKNLGRPGFDEPTDAPAVLLAFPALAATWLGFERRGSRLVEGTFLARMGLLTTAFVSIAAAAVFMLHRVAPNDFTWHQLPKDFTFLWLSDVTWVALVAVALANAVVVCYRYVVETWRYCHLSSRPQEQNNISRSWTS
ncbi:hypothetical protein FHS29_001884 [Saccharothrix tamanrassetensis]|uniref:Uncharacterized protein n=1 Tax=Saccharothrix tamanrassetensis TaxID=1051531 RepID=A0A841CEA6_9PSEU|nr:hypothetical protein [Saccharothrix tamanrassetensis]MBB5955303.1 hypothetical protein [Saccharothrix tamanrassetensis]